MLSSRRRTVTLDFDTKGYPLTRTQIHVNHKTKGKIVESWIHQDPSDIGFLLHVWRWRWWRPMSESQRRLRRLSDLDPDLPEKSTSWSQQLYLLQLLEKATS